VAPRRVILSSVSGPDGVYIVASRLRPYREDPDEAADNKRYFIETVHAAHL